MLRAVERERMVIYIRQDVINYINNTSKGKKRITGCNANGADDSVKCFYHFFSTSYGIAD